MQKDVNNNDSYEIIELNESEPIVFKQLGKQQEQLDMQDSKRVILVVPKAA